MEVASSSNPNPNPIPNPNPNPNQEASSPNPSVRNHLASRDRRLERGHASRLLPLPPPLTLTLPLTLPPPLTLTLPPPLTLTLTPNSFQGEGPRFEGAQGYQNTPSYQAPNQAYGPLF